MFHSNLQKLGEKDKNVFENGMVNMTPMFQLKQFQVPNSIQVHSQAMALTPELQHLTNISKLFLSSLTLFPKQQILDSSKLKEFADDNFRFDENGRMFFKGVENIVEKGEIACYKQFLLFPQCFQKTCTADT